MTKIHPQSKTGEPADAREGRQASPQWPAAAVEMRPLGSVIAYARNPNTHSPEQVDLIAASIREWGWTVPVLVDEDGLILAGHGRAMAAQKLGLTEIPVMTARGWTDAQKRAYVIADNQIPRNSVFDLELLRSEIGDLKLLDFELPLLGFSDLQIVDFVGGLGGNGADPEAVPEPPAEPVSRRGDTWLMGAHRLRCGDATSAEDVAACLNGAKPHLMVTDPPYGVNYDPMWRNRVKRQDGSLVGAKAVGVVTNDHRDDWREAWGLFSGAIAYVWHGGLHAAAVQESLVASNLEIRAQIIWAKQQFVIGRGDYHWQHEPCWYAVRKGFAGGWAGDRKQSTVWSIAAPSGWAQIKEGPDAHTGIHSTQKPVECMRRPIENNSKRGDYVYDPFVGSFTTGIACEMTGRKLLALEIDEGYCDVAVRRWQGFTGKAAVLDGTGQTFEQVQAERAPGAAPVGSAEPPAAVPPKQKKGGPKAAPAPA